MYIRVIYSSGGPSSAVAVFNMAKNPFSFLCMIYYCFLFGRPVSSDDHCGLSRKHLFIIKIIITTRNDDNILYRSLQRDSTEHCGRFKTVLKTARRPFSCASIGSYNILFLCFYLYFIFYQKTRQYTFPLAYAYRQSCYTRTVSHTIESNVSINIFFLTKQHNIILLYT